MNFQQIREAIRQIDSVLQQHPGGRRDETAANCISQSIQSIRFASVTDDYALEKVAEIDQYAQALYSPQKHKHYASPGTSVAE